MTTHGLQYGWGRFTPRVLQVFNGPKSYLLSLSVLCIVKTFTSGYLSQMIPTIEKRFQMSSQDLGTIAASQDVASLIIIGFVSYFGENTNKIKWLGYGGIITGLGCLLSVLSHVIVGPYEPVLSSISSSINSTVTNQGLCVPANGTTDPICLSEHHSKWYYMLIFILSQICIGVGSTPLFSVGPAYLDENLHPKSVPLYIGVWYSTTWLGPGMGFILGGYVSTVYVDIKQPAGANLTPKDPGWIGAWWLGFLAAGLFSIVLSLLMLGFPRELPGAQEIREEAMKAGYVSKKDENVNGKLKEMIPATKNLLTNPTYMWNTIALTTNILFIQGSSSFIAKLVNLMFCVDYNLIGTVLGSVFTPTGIVGIMLGGLICRCFNLKKSCKLAALTVFLMHLIFLWTGFVWWMPGCGEASVAGITTPYHNSPASVSGIGATCNSNCACPTNILNPVCGANNVTYFSACHAGCLGMTSSKMYSNCSCVAQSSYVGKSVNSTTARPGFCVNRNPALTHFMWFMIIIGLNSVIFAIISVPTRIVVLRCVSYNLRSYALGFQFVFTKLLGSIPSPVLFGTVVDNTCLLWGESCGARGACAMYNVGKLTERFVIMALVTYGLSTVFYGLSYWVYKPEGATEGPTEMRHLMEGKAEADLKEINANGATGEEVKGGNEERQIIGDT